MKITQRTRNLILTFIGPVAFTITALALYVLYDASAASASSNPLWLISLLIGAVGVIAAVAVIAGAIVFAVHLCSTGSDSDQSSANKIPAGTVSPRSPVSGSTHGNAVTRS